jgi:hypothetical protein
MPSYFCLNPNKKPKNRPWGGGGSDFIFLPAFLFLLAHAKFQNPTTTPSGILTTGMPRVEYLAKIVAFLSCSAGHTLFAQTKRNNYDMNNSKVPFDISNQQHVSRIYSVVQISHG